MTKNLISVSFLVLVALAIGCSGNRVKPSEPVETVTEALPASVLKRQIKDVDFKARLDEKGPKKRIVVLPFVDIGADRPESARLKAREAFMDELNRSDEIIALDSNQLKVDVTKYMSGGDYDLAKIAKDSQNAGVSSLVEGKIIDLRIKKQTDKVGIVRNLKTTFEAVVRLRIFNVRSGKEIFHTVKTVAIEDESTRIAERVSSDLFFINNPELVTILIKDAFLDFTPQLFESMNVVIWEGRIAALKGEKIYLNVGRISGVQVGDILKVVEDGSEIYDPEIGYHIGKVSGQAKGTLEVVSYFGQDGAVSVIHSGAGFKENDRVELYQ